jgi:hypothetical protein
MRYFTGLFLILASSLLSAFTFQTETEYCNSRFSFCMQVPNGFIGQGEAENGDGQIFLSADKQTEIRAYGMLAIEDFDQIQDQFTMASKGVQVSYKVIKQDWFVLSGLDKDGKIVYRKTVKRKIAYQGDEEPNTPVFQTWQITYPKSQQNTFGAYCGLISKF